MPKETARRDGTERSRMELPACSDVGRAVSMDTKPKGYTAVHPLVRFNRAA
jgi:hypothetical protein